MYSDVISMSRCTALEFSLEDATWLRVSETKGKKHAHRAGEMAQLSQARLTTKNIRNVYIEG